MKQDTSVLSEPEFLRISTDMVDQAAEAGPVSVDPDVAEAMGAFTEDALTAEDAEDSWADGVDPTGEAAHG